MLALQTSGKVMLAGVEILSSELGVKRTFKGDKTVYEAGSSDDGSLMVALDTRSDPGLEAQVCEYDVLSFVCFFRFFELFFEGQGVIFVRRRLN